MKTPQWASVSFGTIFCLECSGVHRSLGVHISFVRSIAMGSWTDQQLALMKTGGNDKCKTYLMSKGIEVETTPIKRKFESNAAQLYKEILKARVAGTPEPTMLPQKKVRAPYVSACMGGGGGGGPSSGNYGGGGGMDMGNDMNGAAVPAAVPKPGEDPSGMERLTGESEQHYLHVRHVCATKHGLVWRLNLVEVAVWEEAVVAWEAVAAEGVVAAAV
jgi:hypothetical protein